MLSSGFGAVTFWMRAAYQRMQDSGKSAGSVRVEIVWLTPALLAPKSFVPQMAAVTELKPPFGACFGIGAPRGPCPASTRLAACLSETPRSVIPNSRLPSGVALLAFGWQLRLFP
jgi:hypothetical protein